MKIQLHELGNAIHGLGNIFTLIIKYNYTNYRTILFGGGYELLAEGGVVLIEV
jgi:hypothetical protein